MAAAALVGAHAAAGAVPATLLSATTREPRAFGYLVGDVVSGTVTVHVPDGLVLDESSLPRPQAHGAALELRHVDRTSSAEQGGRRIELTLAYQVFLSPPQPRTLETPTLTLRFQGVPRPQELRIESWPVTVSPLVPVEVSPRNGLGELRPDTPPLLIDTEAGRRRLMACGGVAVLLLGYLAQVYGLLPGWGRGHGPFTLAWRALRRMPSGKSDADVEVGAQAGSRTQWHASLQRLHEALNLTAGEVVFEQGIDRFISARPGFEHLRGDLVNFFQLSRRAFFAQGLQQSGDRAWLVEFCRRCRNAERGTA